MPSWRGGCRTKPLQTGAVGDEHRNLLDLAALSHSQGLHAPFVGHPPTPNPLCDSLREKQHSSDARFGTRLRASDRVGPARSCFVRSGRLGPDHRRARLRAKRGPKAWPRLRRALPGSLPGWTLATAERAMMSGYPRVDATGGTARRWSRGARALALFVRRTFRALSRRRRLLFRLRARSERPQDELPRRCSSR